MTHSIHLKAKILFIIAIVFLTSIMVTFNHQAAFAATQPPHITRKVASPHGLTHTCGSTCLHPGDAYVLQMFAGCGSNCSTYTWFASNLPPNSTSSFNPPTTVGEQVTTWTLQTTASTPIGSYTVSYGSVDANGNVSSNNAYLEVIPPLLSSESILVTPKTPMWNLDFQVQLIPSNITCPASLSLSIVNISNQAHNVTSSISDVCGGSSTAPSIFDGMVQVFDPTTDNYVDPGKPANIYSTLVEQNNTTYQDGLSDTAQVPPQPVWIGIGDSFASGHEQTQDSTPTCFTETAICFTMPNQPKWSWVTRAATLLNSQLQVPKIWQIKPMVLAKSGATTTQMVSMQESRMDTTLLSNANSWNIVSLTGGANDMNFSGPLAKFYVTHSTLTSGIVPWNVQSKDSQGHGCPNTQTMWNKLGQVSSTIDNNLQGIIDDAQQKDPNVRIVDVDYPYVVDSTNTCAMDIVNSSGQVTWHGSASVVDSLDGLHAFLATSNGNIVHVDLRQSSGFGTSPLGYLQLYYLYGYPHPNDSGQTLMATLAVNQLLSNLP